MSKKRKSITLTGEHTIDNIISHHYGNDLPPEKVVEKKAALAVLNPHIVSLESFEVGDNFYLEDFEDGEEDQDQEEGTGEQGHGQEEEFDLSGLDDLPVDKTVHTDSIKKKKKK